MTHQLFFNMSFLVFIFEGLPIRGDSMNIHEEINNLEIIEFMLCNNYLWCDSEL